MKTILDLIIVGAGPAGLACAIEASKAGLSYVVLDKGSVADAICRFPTDLTFFSTSELLEIGKIPFLTAGFRPTRTEVVRYYQRVARDLSLNVKSRVTVDGIERKSDHFRLSSNDHDLTARNVVIATGYFDDPAPFPVKGADQAKVHRYYEEPFRYNGQKVAIVGGKNSAVETALDLFRNGARVTLIHRGARFSDGVKYWILPDIENRIKSGEISALFETTVSEIKEHSIVVRGKHDKEIENDAVFVMIGYKPDTRLLESAGVGIQPDSLGPVYDSTTMETNVKGLYVAGSVAAGRFNNKIFIENGRVHGGLIISHMSRND